MYFYGRDCLCVRVGACFAVFRPVQVSDSEALVEITVGVMITIIMMILRILIMIITVIIMIVISNDKNGN